MKKLLLLFIASALFIAPVNAQRADRSKFISDSLQNYITHAMTNWRIPGAAVCIIKDGKIVLMKGYGIKELGLNDAVDENTLFMIGSNTKAFTATAICILESEHKLSLDEKVTKYIPDFKLDSKPATELVTLRDLLCHRIGFGTFQGDFTYWTSNLTREQVIEKMAHVKALYSFRSKWGYTNAAFLTAGEIITKATDRSWESTVKDRIFAPLGMGSTLALSKDLPGAYNKAAPHTLVDGRLIAIPFCQIDNLAPAGSISSNVSDMSKWVMALLNNGKVGPRQFIPESAILEPRQAQDIVSDNGTGATVMYGLGWFLRDYSGHRIVYHTGGVNGYVSSVTLVPDQNLGIVILTNTDQNNVIEALREEVVDAYLKKPFRDYSDRYLTQFKAKALKEQQADKKLADSTALHLQPALPVSAYTGKYVSDLYGSMTIDQGGENGELQIRFEHHPKMYALMRPIGSNRFYVTFSDPEFGRAVFPFTVINGRVIGVRVKVADFIEYTPYEFRKVQ